MENEALETLRYPIGHFRYDPEVSGKTVEGWIAILEELPTVLEQLVQPLTQEQLETPYRPGGWTVRQLVHHIADSHHHSYTRFKWALTEEEPVIKAYEEKNWSGLFDAKKAPIELSLAYLKALHAKLVFLLKGLQAEDFERSYIHPEDHGKISVKENIGKYAWHSRHHCAHIQRLLERKGW
ncbi:YfiT family bacillithiol transferase [Maribacter polysaccharolyticus]|uniref:YfiT family bacillithiol transferase n=1 Tax=Maribacter polysaccharolyticus TaxID=3020831 RepID=UPI00237F8A17|nr:putative metal-dependent hydrolase [Maribacter polysaccharolyticus]MDE3741852.1 putative metal-dependent hydrolase [Maribacter polysaccharolyticus]